VSTPPHPVQVLDGASGRRHAVETLIVDDNAVFREVLRDLVAAARGFVLVGEACSGEDAVRAVDYLSPRLVLMDVVMPGVGGIGATRMILNRHPELVVVLISVNDPALDPGATALGKRVACVRKQDLRPKGLSHLWETHRGPDVHAASSPP
jgi:two-component system, NarL family, invasion response regulator UvrY